MKIIEPKYYEVSMTEEEMDTLRKAHDIIEELLSYMSDYHADTCICDDQHYLDYETLDELSENLDLVRYVEKIVEKDEEGA